MVRGSAGRGTSHHHYPPVRESCWSLRPLRPARGSCHSGCRSHPGDPPGMTPGCQKVHQHSGVNCIQNGSTMPPKDLSANVKVICLHAVKAMDVMAMDLYADVK